MAWAVALLMSSRRASSDRLKLSSGCAARKLSSAMVRPMAGRRTGHRFSPGPARRARRRRSRRRAPVALVARVDAVGQQIGADEVAARARASAACRPRRCAPAPPPPSTARRSASVAPSRFGVDSASGRITGLATTIGVSGWPWRTTSRKAAVSRAHHVRAERDAGPAVRAVGDRDDVGVERGDVLGRHDLAAGRARVAHVHDVEAGGRARRSPARRPPARRHPALGDRVAVRDPPGLRRRGLDVAADALDREHRGLHALGQVDDRALARRGRRRRQSHRALAEHRAAPRRRARPSRHSAKVVPAPSPR